MYGNLTAILQILSFFVGFCSKQKFPSTMRTMRKWTIHYSTGSKLFTKQNYNETKKKNGSIKNHSNISRRIENLPANLPSNHKQNKIPNKLKRNLTEQKLVFGHSEFTIILWYISFQAGFVMLAIHFCWLANAEDVSISCLPFFHSIQSVQCSFGVPLFHSILHSIPIFRLLIFSGIFTFYILLRYFIKNKISPILSTSPNRYTNTH